MRIDCLFFFKNEKVNKIKEKLNTNSSNKLTVEKMKIRDSCKKEEREIYGSRKKKKRTYWERIE